MSDESFDAWNHALMTMNLQEHWAEFKAVELPSSARQFNVNGLSLVFLDEDLSTLLDVFFDDGSSFTSEQAEQFAILVDDLEEVVLSTADEVKSYFSRLQTIVAAVAGSAQQ